MVEPVGLAQVTRQVDAIRHVLDGGFPAALAAARAGTDGTGGMAAGAAAVRAAGTPTALLTGALLGGPDAAAGSGGGFSLATASPGGTGSAGAQAVAIAERYLGVPYVWGGESPSGFDCSGLVQYVYGQLGVRLPRTSEEQALAGTAVPSLAQARPGDLVFFAGSDGTAQSPGHVGIYIGDGEMIEAPHTGADVRIEPVADPVAIRRVLPAAPPAPSAYAAGAAGSVLGAGAAAGAAGPYGALFARATADYHLPSGLLEAVATAESGMDPSAISPAGAEGLMQIMPQVASGMGIDPRDPKQAVPAAASMLSGYLERFGSLPLALAAYNAGPGAVAAHGGIPSYPQTQAYVRRVLGLMGTGS